MSLFNTVSKVHTCHQGQGETQPWEHQELLFTLALVISVKWRSPPVTLDPMSYALGHLRSMKETPTEAMLWLQKAETFPFDTFSSQLSACSGCHS